jgi:hypothetical protein
MRQRVDIRPATLRDASWVTANLRPLDHREAFCQLREGVKTHELAYFLVHGGDAFVADYIGTPAMVFGTMPINVCCLSVWALGTRHAWRVATAVSTWLRDTYLPEKAEQGFTSMEARSLVDHAVAHRWMESTGAVRATTPFVFGKGGEEFILFRWTVDKLTGNRLIDPAGQRDDHVPQAA